jgi:hypothetical protein
MLLIDKLVNYLLQNRNEGKRTLFRFVRLSWPARKRVSLILNNELFSCRGIHRTLMPRSGGIACIKLRAAGESVRSLVVP